MEVIPVLEESAKNFILVETWLDNFSNKLDMKLQSTLKEVEMGLKVISEAEDGLFKASKKLK